MQFHLASRLSAAPQGGRVLDRSQQAPNPCPSWVSEEAWDNLSSLEQLPAFKGLASSLESAAQDWELWFRQAQPEAAELPRDWDAKCNELQRLLLVRSLRPDRVIFAATTYVANAIGRQFVEPPVLDLGQVLADSSPLTPLIFLLSPGVDPTDQLRKLAAERGMVDKLHTVALGQGQVGVAACRCKCSSLELGTNTAQAAALNQPSSLNARIVCARSSVFCCATTSDLGFDLCRRPLPSV